MSQSADPVYRLAIAYTAAWCSHIPEQVAAHYAEDGSLAINGGEAAIGRASIADFARSFMVAFPDLQVFFDRLVSDGGQTEYHWTLTDTNTGPGGTGRPVRISGFELWRLSPGGLIQESLGHFDAEDYNRQLIGPR